MSGKSSIFTFGVMGLGVWLSSAAGSLAQSGVPSEFPPKGYSGTQYIDSAGCAFIRTGVDGNVSWTPRVRQDGEQICGLTPTKDILAGLFPKDEPSSAATNAMTQPSSTTVRSASQGLNAVESGTRDSSSFVEELLDSRRQAQALESQKKLEAEGLKQVAQQGLDAEAAPARKSSPNAAELTVPPALIGKVKDQGIPSPKVKKPSTRQNMVMKKQRTLPITLTPHQRDLVNSICGPVNRVSAKYLRSSKSYTIRCGPQSQSPVTVVMQGQVRDGRLVPMPKAVAKVNNAGIGATPDFRIGMTTKNNIAAMAGFEPAHKDNRYGYGTSKELRPIGTVAQNYSSYMQGAASFLPQQPAAHSGAKLVQVASFSNPQNVQRTVARLSGMGYPVRTQKMRGLTVVMVAPAQGMSITQALGAMRQIGFRDAFIR